jgi:transposase-like protein
VEGARRATGTSPSPWRSKNETATMSSSNPSERPNPKKRRFLTAEKKFQIYLEAQDSNQPVGEILRREGLYSTDLARIRQQVKEGALQRLGAKPGRKQEGVSSADYEALKRELQEKERALAEQSVELVILRKKTNGGSWDR